MISRAMQHLVAARLVTVVHRGRFQLHPTLAAFDSPRDQQRAIAALPRGHRLDVGDFEDEYERRLELHQQAKARKAEQGSKVAAISRPRLKPAALTRPPGRAAASAPRLSQSSGTMGRHRRPRPGQDDHDDVAATLKRLRDEHLARAADIVADDRRSGDG